MSTRHRQEKTYSASGTPSNGHVQELSSRKNHSNATKRCWKLKPHVALKWDADKQKVVSKPDQVSISWGHLISHSSGGHHNRGALADVLQVPPELFQLEGLQDVLTFETWNGCLSALDRQFLRELLPKEVDREDLVRSLLSGDNFHFGNPLATWGYAVCEGDLHPDSVRQRDLEFKRTQEEYHVELEKYHHKMLETLGTLKELWASCKSAEKELGVKLKRWAERKSSKIEAGSIAANTLVPQELKVACVLQENRNLKEDMVVRQRCKRRKIGSLQQALERTDSLPAEASKRINHMMYNAVNVDGCIEIMYTLKVTRKQYADIIRLKERGDDILLESLSSILDGSQKIGVHRLNGCDRNDTSNIRKFWSSLVENEIPAAYATFLERKAHKRTQAKSAAEQCMERLPRFLSKEDIFICKSSSNVSASVVSSEEKFLSNHRIEHESSLGTEAGKQKQLSASESSVTCMEGQLGMQATVDSCISSANAMNSQVQQLLSKSKTDGWSKFDEDPVILTSMHEERSGRLQWSMGEGEGSPMQVRHHFEESKFQKDTMAASESDLSEDGVSAIKNIWSSSDLDTQELHSHNDGVPAVKEVNSFLSRKGSNIWDSHSKPASEVNVGSGSTESDEVDQRISFQAANFCTGLDTHLLDSHTMPSFDNHDQLFNFLRHTPFFRHQDTLLNRALFFSNHATESSTDEHRLQHHDHSQKKHSKLDAGSLMSCKSNSLTEVNDFCVEMDQRHTAMFSLEQDKVKIEHGEKQQMLLPKVLNQKAHSDGFLSSDMSSNHSGLASPVHTYHSRRNGSLCETSQPRSHLSLASPSVHECSQQNHEPITELRLLVDDRTEEHLGHLQQMESVSLNAQHDPVDRQMMRDNTEQVQNFPLYHQLHQNQQFQHSKQDLYSPCTISPLLSGWPGSQQILADRTTSTNTNYGPTGQWNVGEDTLQANWSHMKIVPGPFSIGGKNEDRRAPTTLSRWDRLSQNPYIVENGLPKHGQFVGMPRSFSCGSYSSLEDKQGVQVQVDWARVHPFSATQHPYISIGDKSRTTAPHHWMNVSPGSHISQQSAQYDQQADQPLSKPNSHLGSSWVEIDSKLTSDHPWGSHTLHLSTDFELASIVFKFLVWLADVE